MSAMLEQHPHTPIEVRRSTRRRKTATAFWQDDTVVVVLPAWMRPPESDAMVENLVRRVLAQRPNCHASDDDLAARAAFLAERYLSGTLPGSIRWVANQLHRWGSCSLASRDIRVSDRLKVVPDWVLDAVLVHELAHLDEPSHSDRFRRMAGRYPRMDDADTFLQGFSLGLEHAAGFSDKAWSA